MLKVGFAELSSTYRRIAGELEDNPFDTLGVLALMEKAQSKHEHDQRKQQQQQQQQLPSLVILLDFKALLVNRFSKFIGEQVQKRNETKHIGPEC